MTNQKLNPFLTNITLLYCIYSVIAKWFTVDQLLLEGLQKKNYKFEPIEEENNTLTYDLMTNNIIKNLIFIFYF